MNKIFSLLVIMAAFSFTIQSQELTQTIRGIILDETSEVSLPGATVWLQNTDPVIGAISNADGEFALKKVPAGRYTVLISFIGYETAAVQNVVVHTGKSNYLTIKLKESLDFLEEVVVKGERPKDVPLNSMAHVSSRAFTIEETERYAAGLDDPARMATAFAGVTNSSLGQNAIVVRGNAPKGVQWKIEGIEIPNPSHFAGSSTTGGGLVTLLSINVLNNSDFMTGAFPAEYGNALSGVFDMNLRKGNNQTYEHSFKAGLLGIDFASEGPLSKKNNSSYLFNYRYSTFGLIEPILPDETNTIKYQDLSFKLSFPTKAGEFSLWGIGGNDFGKKNEPLVLDPAEWEEENDIIDDEFGFDVGATGLSHKINLSDNTLLKTSLVATVKSAYWDLDKLNDASELLPESRVESLTGTYSFSTTLNHKFSRKITNRSGFLFHRQFYDLKSEEALNSGDPLRTIVKEDGVSYRAQAFTQTKFRINNSFELNAGLHSQYFDLNEQITIEPRSSVKWNINNYNSMSLGYGNHSQMEDAKIYFVQDGDGNNLNEDLKMGRAHHLVFSYDWSINENLRFKIEPYYQHLYDIPVIADSSFSMINFEQDWFFDEQLENSGKGRNYGVDITMERFLSNNFYYLVTGSLFESEYKGGDGAWRDSRFNRNYAFNILGGKEWQAGASDNKWWSLSFGLTLMGGKKISPLDEQASILAREEVLNETRAFDNSEPAIYNLDMTVSRRKNRARYSTVWSLQLKNMIGSEDYDGHYYDYKKNAMVERKSTTVIPNLSYKIEF